MTFPGSKHNKTYLRTIVGDDAATALLVIDGIDFVGDSKRHPGDRFNFTIGESLAIARALRDAAEWYERQANDLIAHMERMEQATWDWNPAGGSWKVSFKEPFK